MGTKESTKGLRIEKFAVDVDGVRKCDQLDFPAAVSVAMEYRQTLPSRHIHVSDADAPPIAPI
jgi:hypothetical protein